MLWLYLCGCGPYAVCNSYLLSSYSACTVHTRCIREYFTEIESKHARTHRNRISTEIDCKCMGAKGKYSSMPYLLVCVRDCRLRIELFSGTSTLLQVFFDIPQSTYCTHAHTDTQHIAFAIHYYCVNLRLNLVQFISTVEWI